VQLGLGERGIMKDNWSTLDQYFSGFYCKILKQDGLYHVLRFIHFSDNKNEHNKTDGNLTDFGK